MWLRMIQGLWFSYLAKASGLNIKGRENIPGDTNFIVAANHDGYFDGEFVLYAFKKYNIHFFYHIPDDFGKYFLKWWYRGKGLGVSYNKPNSREINRKALKNAVEYLKNGKNIGIMPQGISPDRYIESRKRPFYPGCAIISCKSGRPVIPVRILNHETYIYDSEKHISPMGVIRLTIKRMKENAKNNDPVFILIGSPIYPDMNKYLLRGREYITEFTNTIKQKIFELEDKFKEGEQYV